MRVRNLLPAGTLGIAECASRNADTATFFLLMASSLVMILAQVVLFAAPVKNLSGRRLVVPGFISCGCRICPVAGCGEFLVYRLFWITAVLMGLGAAVAAFMLRPAAPARPPQ